MRVVIGYCHPDMVHSIWHASLVQLLRKENRRVAAVFGVRSGPKIDSARNQIVAEFLKGNGTHLLMVDTDMVLPPNTIERLLRADREIVGGLAFIGSFDGSHVRPNIVEANVVDDKSYTLNPVWEYPQGLVEVDAIGAACMMVKREVFENMRLARGEDHPMPWFAHGVAGNVEIGEDIAFCLTARKMGYSVWCDTRLVVPHAKIRYIDDEDYVESLAMADHPYYAERERVPIYQKAVNGDDSNLSNRQSGEELPDEGQPGTDP